MVEQSSVIGRRPKSRGRPVEVKGDAAADIQRARVRRAQTAFRRRKEQHVAKLEERCRDLEEVAEGMSNTFMGFTDELLASRTVDPEKIKLTIETFLRLSRRATPGQAGENSDDDSSSSGPVGSTTISKIMNVDHAPSLQDRSAAVNPYHSTTPDGSDIVLNYGLWSNPASPSPIDGSSAVPYILARRDSFASRLYFETIVLTVRALRGDDSLAFLNSMFRYKLKFSNTSSISAVVSGLLNVMLHGTSQDPSSGRTGEYLSQQIQDDNHAIAAAILKDVIADGASKLTYLTSWEVERYLKDKWGLAIDSKSIRVQPRALLDGEFSTNWSESPTLVAPTFVPGFVSEEARVFDTAQLVERLKNYAVTIGQGPRWHFAQINAAVQLFLGENARRV